MVEVSYTVGDLYAVTFQSWRRLIGRVLVLFGILIAIFIAVPIILDGLSFLESVRWFPWDFYLGLIGFLLLFLFGVCPLINYFRLKRQGVLGPNYFEFADDGVRLESPKGKLLVYWNAVTRFVTSQTRFLLFIGPANALVVPRRAFESQAGYEASISDAKAYWDAARQ